MRISAKLSGFSFAAGRFLGIACLFCLLWATAVQAQQRSRVDQLTDEQVLEFYRRAEASGLNEMQIEQAAMSQGYTLDDISKMRRRISELRSGTSRPKSQTATPGTRMGNANQVSGGRTLPDDLSERTDTLQPPIRRDTVKKLQVFGASLFANAQSSMFEPNLRIATPRNYIVGPDDEISIDIAGAASDNFQLKVSPEGTVKVPNIAPIFVSGLTVEQAEQRIIDRLRKAGYQGLGVPGSGISANVALTNIRSIRVTLTGEVVRPGTYTISSLGTAFNALYLAGGPNPKTGSFRKISIIRGNRIVRTIDLYDFLLRADQRDNIRLQDQDVIRVADYVTHVTLTGEVRRPAIFEVLPGETLKTLLGFAGGFSDEAYRASISLRRNTARERKVMNITEEQLNAFVPQQGDYYTVGRILNRYENRIQVAGAIMRPGDYALEPGLETVKQLISRADGLRQDAFMNRAIILRERPDMDRETVSFDLGKLMRGEIADIPLMRQDSLTILSIRDLREPYYVIIEGAVNKPDTIEYVSRMGVADAIALAGGFQEGAKPSLVEVARRIRKDSAGVRSSQVELFRFAVDRNLLIGKTELTSGRDTAFQLEPFDIVYVRTSVNYNTQQQVTVMGEVMQPGTYAISDRQERIADVIKRAGGLRPEAYPNGGRFIRRGKIIGNSLQLALDNNQAEENLLVQDGDTIVVPRRAETVAVEGAVLNPSTVSFKEKFRFDDYIAQAGGYTDNARKTKAYVIYPNGRKATKRPKIEPGSTIMVPFKPMDTTRLSAAERIGILSMLTTLSIAVLNFVLK